MISNKHQPVKPFGTEIWQSLDQLLNNLPKEADRIAAFDADGTLWDIDLGESFFDYQIDNCGLSLPRDPWAHYKALKNPDPRVGYAWLAQINAGRPLSQVRQWARQNVDNLGEMPVFASMQELIERLRALHFRIYVVTASIKWAVEPGAEKFFKLPHENVLGVETETENGIVSEQVVYPITWREGKAEALLKATGGKKPLVCAGNTYGDTALLELAQWPLALQTQNSPGRLFDEEHKLLLEARARGWRTHSFV